MGQRFWRGMASGALVSILGLSLLSALASLAPLRESPGPMQDTAANQPSEARPADPASDPAPQSEGDGDEAAQSGQETEPKETDLSEDIPPLAPPASQEGLIQQAPPAPIDAPQAEQPIFEAAPSLSLAPDATLGGEMLETIDAPIVDTIVQEITTPNEQDSDMHTHEYAPALPSPQALSPALPDNENDVVISTQPAQPPVLPSQ